MKGYTSRDIAEMLKLSEDVRVSDKICTKACFTTKLAVKQHTDQWCMTTVLRENVIRQHD